MTRKTIFLTLALLAAVSCQKQQYVIYDNPYVYVYYSNDSSLSETSSVLSMSNNLQRTYNVCLSSRRRDTPLTVSYEIVVGDGLTEGVDFEMVTEGSSVTFEPDTYVQPITIKYLRRKVDKTQDNTITIRLTGADSEMQLGIPGAVPKNVTHTIKKTN